MRSGSIVVNGLSIDIDFVEEVSYEDAVYYALHSGTHWTVTVFGPNTQRSLKPGESVPYEDGLVFNVADTGSA